MTRLQRNSGFTIVEVIVVMVVLAVLGAAMAPRLTSSAGRRAKVEAQAIERTLSAAAMRDAMSSQRVALDFDGSVLRALTYGAAEQTPHAVRAWRVDPLIPEARLAELSLAAGAADVEPLSGQGFRIEFPRMGRRPEIDLRLLDSRGVVWRASLGSSAMRAVAGPEAEVTPAAAAGVVDLDATGQGRRPW